MGYKTKKVLSNSSADIIATFVRVGTCEYLRSENLATEIETLTTEIFDGLSNAVYRAGKTERQVEYDEAVDSVFATMDRLENRLSDRKFLFGAEMTTADVRLFAWFCRKV